MSGYRRGTNWVQGYTNVADFAGTFAVGIEDRAEIFGSFLVDTRIDRDVRPLFVARSDVRRRHRSLSARQSVLDRRQRRRFLRRREGQSAGRSITQKPAAIAVRGMVKLPTGEQGRRRRHGQGGLLGRRHRQQGSGEGGRGVGLSAATSGAGSPTASTCRRARSAGARASAFPSRNSLRVTRELNGVRAVERHGDDHDGDARRASTAAVPPLVVEHREHHARDARR